MSIRPLHDRIPATRLAGNGKTVGAPFIPDSAKEQPLESPAIAVGSGKLLERGKTLPLSVRAGDQLIIDENGKSFTQQDATKFALCRGGGSPKKRFWYARNRFQCSPQSEQMLEDPTSS